MNTNRFAVRVEYPGGAQLIPCGSHNEGTRVANAIFDLCLDLFPDVPVSCFVIEV